MSKLVIVVPVGRHAAGRAVLLGNDGKLRLAPFRVLATSSGSAATRHGNSERDWRRPFGDTPTGSYLVAGALPPSAGAQPLPEEAHADRLGALVLSPVGGNALEALRAGRTRFLVHGGPADPSGRLRPTFGGLRVSDADLATLLAAINQANADADPVTSVEVDETSTPAWKEGSLDEVPSSRNPRRPGSKPLPQPVSLGETPKPPAQPVSLGETPKPPAQPVSLGETPKPPAQPVSLGETPKPPAQPVSLGETPKPPAQPVSREVRAQLGFGAPSRAAKSRKPASSPPPTPGRRAFMSLALLTLGALGLACSGTDGVGLGGVGGDDGGGAGGGYTGGGQDDGGAGSGGTGTHPGTTGTTTEGTTTGSETTTSEGTTTTGTTTSEGTTTGTDTTSPAPTTTSTDTTSPAPTTTGTDTTNPGTDTTTTGTDSTTTGTDSTTTGTDSTTTGTDSTTTGTDSTTTGTDSTTTGTDTTSDHKGPIRPWRRRNPPRDEGSGT